MTRSPIEQLVNAISDVVNSDAQWRVVSGTGMLVRAIPNALEAVLSALGAVEATPGSAWLTLNFWVQSPAGGLGVFWRANRVTDLDARNRLLNALLDDSARTGFVYQGTKGPWSEMADPAFSGRTISGRWWPKGSPPDLVAARTDVRHELAAWTQRLPFIVSSIRNAMLASGDSVAETSVDEDPQGRPAPARPGAVRSATTPPIPRDIKEFRCRPHYISIFEIYADETHLFGTEDLYGDWNADVLLLAKDAGSTRNFLPRDKGGDGWAWVHNPARPTNRNLVPLAEALPCAKLYASILACLLRNDDQESGTLVIDDAVRAFIKRVLNWTIENMPRLRSVAVLGEVAWREAMLGLGIPHEVSRARWKQRHTSGEPYVATIESRKIEFFALYHPARIAPDRLMSQAGWQRLHAKHNAT